MADLKLQVLLNMIDQATAPLKKVLGGSKALSAELKRLRDTKRDLDKQLAAVEAFRKLRDEMKANVAKSQELRQKQKQLQEAMHLNTGGAKELQAQIKKLATENGKVTKAYSGQLEKLRAMRQAMQAAGFTTKQFTSREDALRADLAKTTAAIDKQNDALKRAGALRGQFQRRQALGMQTSVNGYASYEVGRRVLEAAHPILGEAKTYQTTVAQMRAQGTSAADIQSAERFANTDTTRGSSINDKLEIVKDANSIFRDMHEALAVSPELLKTKFVFEGLMAKNGEGAGGGQETVNQLLDAVRTGELRNATKTPEEFKRLLNHMAMAYVGSGGLVKPSDYLEVMKTGGVAAKQMDERALFFGAMHTVQEMSGMRAGTGFATAYQNWAAGRSTQQAAEALGALGLVNKDAVKYGKNGHITKMLPGALVNQQLYETNPFEYMMKEVIPRINPTGKLSDDQIVSKLNALFSGRKGGDLFAGMYMQRANIMKQLGAAEKFAGLDDAYKSTGDTAQGKEVDYEGKKATLYLKLGQLLLPAYTAALEKLTDVIQRATDWAKEHPTLAKWMTVIGAAIGVMAVVAGGAMIALGGLIGQIALLRYVSGRGGLLLGLGKARGALPAATAVARAGVLPPALPKIGLLARAGGMFGGEGGMLARAGMLLTTGISLPVLAIGAALVAVAVLVWKYWKPIKAFFVGLGQGIWETLKPAFDALAEAFAPLKPAFATLSKWMSELFTQSESSAGTLKAFGDAGRWLGHVLGTIIRVQLTVVITAIKMLVWAFKTAGEYIGYVMFRVEDFVTKACANIKQMFSGWWDIIAGIFTLNGARVMKGWHELWSGFGGLINTVVDAIKTSFTDAFDFILSKIKWISEKWTALMDVFKKESGSAAHPGWDFNDGRVPPRIVQNAPLRAGGAGGGAATINYGGITIHAPQGADAKAIARETSMELDRRERAKAAQRNSSLTDHE